MKTHDPDFPEFNTFLNVLRRAETRQRETLGSELLAIIIIIIIVIIIIIIIYSKYIVILLQFQRKIYLSKTYSA